MPLVAGNWLQHRDSGLAPSGQPDPRRPLPSPLSDSYSMPLVVSLVAGSSTETVDWPPPVNLTQDDLCLLVCLILILCL